MLNEYLYLKNGAERTHIVIKIDDLIKYVKAPVKLALLDNDLKDIQAGRKSEGKEPIPEYLVVNTDEPYADLVYKIILNKVTTDDIQELKDNVLEQLYSFKACVEVYKFNYDLEKINKAVEDLKVLCSVLEDK